MQYGWVTLRHKQMCMCSFNIFLWKSWFNSKKYLIANYPTTDKSIDRKKQNLFISEHGRERREGGSKRIRDLSLDNLKTRIVHVVISESGSPDDVENPPKRSRGQWRLGRAKKPHEKGKVADARPLARHIIRVRWFFYWLSCRCVVYHYVYKTGFQRRTSLVLHTLIHNRALCVFI